MSAIRRGEFSKIPILDVSGLHGEDQAAIRNIATSLRSDLENVGFIYVVGHRIPRSDVEAVREAGKRFFAARGAEACAQDKPELPGYLPYPTPDYEIARPCRRPQRRERGKVTTT